MEFEYDSNKSRANKLKHGMDFEDAQALWDDPNALELEARSDTEKRFMVVGRLHGKMWSAFITYRDGAIRIISVRRSRKQEVEHYEQELARRRA